MQPLGVPSLASALEETPITLTHSQLAAMIQWAIEDALVRECRRAIHPLPNLEEHWGAYPYLEKHDIPPPNNKEMKVHQEEERFARGEGLVRTIPCFASHQVRWRPTLFTEEIILEEPLSSFCSLHLGEYTGLTDPNEHLCKFKNAVLLHQYSNAIKCRVFDTTLVGLTYKWF